LRRRYDQEKLARSISQRRERKMSDDFKNVPNADDDITKNRHKGNKFSRKANPTAGRKGSMRRAVYDYILALGIAGCTCDQAGAALGLNGRSSSGRCSELKRDGFLFGTNKGGPSESGDPHGGEILIADVYYEAFKAQQTASAQAPDTIEDDEEAA
jgi:hypothetical protein